jgi:uncharacterized protein
MRPTAPHITRHWRRWALLAALIPAIAWTAASAALWFGQERLLFQPVTLAQEASLSADPDVHEHLVEVPGARLSVLELRLPHPKGLVFFLHGNSGNLKEWFINADFYRRANFDLVMMDYRGFGKSSGQIDSEAQLHADVQAVWEAVAPRYQGRAKVVYGRSLGTGLAAELASRVHPDLTILVSAYFSISALADANYPWVPKGVLRYPLRTDVALRRLKQPVLLIHGERDEVIPLAHSERLAALAPQARLVRVPGAGHADLHKFDHYQETLALALGELR